MKMFLFPENQVESCNILVVGDVMLDRYWFGRIDRLSPEAPVPILNFEYCEDRLGGAANVAYNVVSLGAQATLIGIIGSDEAGSTLQVLVEKAKIKSALITQFNYSTTMKIRVLGKQKQLLRVDFEHSDQSSSETGKIERIFSEIIEQYDVVVFSDYGKGSLNTIQSLISISRKKRIPILVDPKGKNYNRYYGVQLLTPNALEISQIIGNWNSESELTYLAQSLRLKLDIEALLITRSSKGMTLFTDHQRDHENVKSQEIFDVSGAGDTVIATLAVCRGIGLPWNEAMYWANQAGGIVVRKLGTSIVSLKELIGGMA